MEHLTIKDIVEITGGRLLGGDENVEIREFAIDSREGNEHSIFVPLIGENVDAHRFMDGALQINGAAFTQEHEESTWDKPVIRVEDTLKAMQQVGTWYRDSIHIPVVAVTGSVGKTTTREMTATALSGGLRVYQTKGNQNSQIGVPLTLSHMSNEDQVAVLEIGMSERGQIEGLSKMIRPNIAIVTLIGVSHIAQLGSQENICQEKMDIVKGMADDGIILLNGDDPFLTPYRGKLTQKTFFYGFDESCDYRAENICSGDGVTEFTLVTAEEKIPVTLNTVGEHNVRDSLAALGAAHQMGVDLTAAAKALSDFHGQRLKVVKGGKFTVIDDTYNASPDSMKASVNVLSDMKDVKGRKIAVLADMLELGPREREFHYEVGAYIASKAVDEVVVYGHLSWHIIDGIIKYSDRITVKKMRSREELTRYLLGTVDPGDVVLLKGSNGMKLKEVAAKLIEAGK